MKKQIQTPQAPLPLANYSQGIRVNNTLYVQGMIALDPKTNRIVDGGIKEQTAQVFANIKAVLEADGLTLANVVRATVFLSEIKDYPSFNEVYNRNFNTPIPPVRTTVQAKLPLGALVEIEVLAAE